MANSKASQNLRNLTYAGKQAFLPPKSPFLGGSTICPEFVPIGFVGSKPVQMPREGNTHHLRTSSESFLIEEQPSWLDDLLNEPDTPVRKAGHRRSSSDSFTYVDVTNASNLHYSLWDDCRYENGFAGHHGKCPKEFDHLKDSSRYVSSRSAFHSGKQKNKACDSISDSEAHPSNGSRYLENASTPSSGSSNVLYETDKVSCGADGKTALAAQFFNNSSKASSEKKDVPQAKPAASDTDTKRARQQFAQRSRVRKIQYIAELERNVQALQAEGSEASAELEFLNQRNLILSMENKALKQRLESLAQEHVIKHLEHEVLEKEIVRLRALHQHQQQLEPKKQVPSSHLGATKSRDLVSQFTNLSLRP